MFELIVNHFLGNIPEWVWPFMAGAGFVFLALNNRDIVFNRILIAGLGYLIFRGINELYRLIRGRDGLGQGDAKLVAVIGLWTGVEGILGATLYAGCSAFISLLVLYLTGKKIESRLSIAFGPHLAFGFWLAWILGPIGF